MINTYFISFTVYEDGNYCEIINKSCTIMNLSLDEVRQLNVVHNAVIEFCKRDAQLNGAVFNPEIDTVVIDNISKIN